MTSFSIPTMKESVRFRIDVLGRADFGVPASRPCPEGISGLTADYSKWGDRGQRTEDGGQRTGDRGQRRLRDAGDHRYSARVKRWLMELFVLLISACFCVVMG